MERLCNSIKATVLSNCWKLSSTVHDLWSLIFSHESKGGGTDPDVSTSVVTAPTIIAPTPTKTTASPTTSPTGVARERIAVFTKDISPGHFFFIVAGLFIRGNIITDLLFAKEISFYALLGTIYDSDALALSLHPLLDGLGLNGKGKLDEADLRRTINTREDANVTDHHSVSRWQPQKIPIQDHHPLDSSSSSEGEDILPANVVEEAVFEVFGPNIPPEPLEAEPFALQWLGSLWAQNALVGHCGYLIPIPIVLMSSAPN